jgi:hypothetical protein
MSDFKLSFSAIVDMLPPRRRLEILQAEVARVKDMAEEKNMKALRAQVQVDVHAELEAFLANTLHPAGAAKDFQYLLTCLQIDSDKLPKGVTVKVFPSVEINELVHINERAGTIAFIEVGVETCLEHKGTRCILSEAAAKSIMLTSHVNWYASTQCGEFDFDEDENPGGECTRSHGWVVQDLYLYHREVEPRKPEFRLCMEQFTHANVHGF